MAVEKIFYTKGKTKEEWLRKRKEGIGGSESATLLGLNPWSNPLDLYVDKTTDRIKKIETERMRIGNDLEEYVAKRFEEATGKKVRRNNYMMRNTKFPKLIANIDREIVGENAGLECKTTNSYTGKTWIADDGDLKIPYNYLIQMHHYMTVLEYDHYYFAVLIGNERFKWTRIERDEEISRLIVDTVNSFYRDYIDVGEEPRPDGTKLYTEILNEKWKSREVKEPKELPDKLQGRVERYWQVNDLIKDLKVEKEQIEQEVKIEMKEDEKAVIGDTEFTWKTQTRRTIDTKKIKEDYPELTEKYTKETESRYFRKKRR